MPSPADPEKQPPLKTSIIATAVRHFARNGFDGASTRDIARDCDTPMSSITYHFGGKEGLYLAVAEHIATHIHGRIANEIAEAKRAGTAGAGDAGRALLALLESLAAVMLDPGTAEYAILVCREQQEPSAAFDKLYDGCIRDVAEAAVSLVSACQPDMPLNGARATAAFLLGQVIVLRTGKATLERTFGKQPLGPDEVAQLLQTLRKMTVNTIGLREMAT